MKSGRENNKFILVIHNSESTHQDEKCLKFMLKIAVASANKHIKCAIFINILSSTQLRYVIYRIYCKLHHLFRYIF